MRRMEEAAIHVPGIDQNLAATRRLHELVRDHPDFEVLCEPTLDPYYFRCVPTMLAERQEEPEIQALLDRLNEEIVEKLERMGLTLVKTARVRGRIAIQVSSLSAVDTTFEVIAQWARTLNRKQSISYQTTTPDLEAELCSSESHSSLTEVSAT